MPIKISWQSTFENVCAARLVPVTQGYVEKAGLDLHDMRFVDEHTLYSEKVLMDILVKVHHVKQAMH